MIGPFKPPPDNFKCVFVLVDKFSKWIEYMPLTKASSEKAVEFLDQVIHCFGLPNSIIIELGTQFTGSVFWDFCDERSIVVKYVSVAHPRANGQVERANGMILDTLKKRLYRENDKAPGRWLKELPTVVWGLRTQPSRNTGASPYFIVYDAEAVLPVDIVFRSSRVKFFDEDRSDEARELEVNCSEERRLNSCVRTTKYLAILCRYYNRNVKECLFVVGDLVLKWKTNQEGMHKLSSLWEGPFEVIKVTRPTSYRLAHLDGTTVPNSWHIDKLRYFYKAMYPTCVLIILIKWLYFFLITLICLFEDHSSTNILQISQLIDHHFFSSSRSQLKVLCLVLVISDNA
jgi:hypothetical protein